MIIHLDADAFFASVEQAGNAALRGKAIAVGGERRGIIASASYEARKFGVYTPMPSVKAKRVCPELIIVHGDFAKYRKYSRRMFDLVDEFTPDVERTSIDEGYFDLGPNQRIAPIAVATKLQQTISDELGISVSLGIGTNKLIAQIASKLRKPHAIVEVAPGTEPEFLAPLECHWLPGVGPKLAARLREVGLHFVRQIAEAPIDFLAQVVGTYAPQLQAYARGIDSRRVIVERDDAKSYGTQETFDENVASKPFVLATLQTMADELMSKLRRDSKAARTITVRLRYSDMSDVSHGATLAAPTNLETDIYFLLPRLLRETWRRQVNVRLAGLRLTNLSRAMIQAELPLDAEARRRARQHDTVRLLDALRARSLPLMRGHSLGR